MSGDGHEGGTRSGGPVDAARSKVGDEGAAMETTERYVEIARAESERGELVLRERRDPCSGSVLELRANGVFVMDTLETSTERALASAALELVDDPRAVVVCGLGLGYTMHEVLADHRVERCAVVEIEEALVEWMRTGVVPHGPALLADGRVHLVVADVAVAFAEARPSSYDLVLLDVDNGPGYLVHDVNARLYDAPFLSAVRAALRPGGVLIVWSADRAPELEETLRGVFGNADARALDVLLQDRDEQYWLHVARVPSPA
ncbi:spermidine synthase [Nocardioides sp.]|uniref:spermidine synthase n=1 Tax=Nocardioides sp. TaxID=35761 RepID=UPI00356B1D7B